MASTLLIDGHVAAAVVERASSAIHAYVSQASARQDDEDLLGAHEDFVWLVVGVKRMTPGKNLKPHRIPLSHSLVDPRTQSVCLITKDPQREYKDLLEANKIKFISRVVGVDKLKGKFKPFEARRQLLQDHDLFLADDRVVPMLPKLLGKIFFTAKKQPVPVSLTKTNIKTRLENAISSTYLHQNQGTCTSIKIATSSHSSAQIAENLATAIPPIIASVADGWDNIQSLHIKTSQSASLPIWTCNLGAGERWGSLSPLVPSVPSELHPLRVNGGNKRPREQDVEPTEPGRPHSKVGSRSIKTTSPPTASKEPRSKRKLQSL
ncbi:ribosomal protein L1 [Clavulina sp. PMI_390]|nr:ribosomal protein L1 [Clavulina sp. PMI_390]